MIKNSINLEKLMILMKNQFVESYLNIETYEISFEKMCTDKWIRIENIDNLIEDDLFYSYIEAYLEKKIKDKEDIEFIKKIDFQGDFEGLLTEYDLCDEYGAFLNKCMEKKVIEWCEINSINYNMEKLSSKEDFEEYVMEKEGVCIMQKIHKKDIEEKNEFCEIISRGNECSELKKVVDDSDEFEKLLDKYKLSEQWEEFYENNRREELDEMNMMSEEKGKKKNAILKKLCEKYGL